MPGAYLRGAHLWKTDLRGAVIHYANLEGAYLKGANLQEAHLWRTDLTKADLTGADLTEASLTEASLRETDLTKVNLEDARSLKDTNLRGVKGLTKEQLEACKAKGAIIDEDTMTSSLLPSLASQGKGIRATSA